VTDVCYDVGFASLGTFSKTFHSIVGASPTAYRLRGHVVAVPTCFAMAWTRPSSFGEDAPTEQAYGIDCGLRDPFGHIRVAQMFPGESSS
jgi:hypothetical protein